ncbi:hypothetical protein HYV10_01470 [Candidatus Dependentiae bacterium]|nr:hypothetical protein [Candidatus Dependentiae bacterium]
MKNLYIIMVLSLSSVILSPGQESREILRTPTELVHDVQDFLNKFSVARLYHESQGDFIKRLKESHEYISVTFGQYPSINCTKGQTLEVNKKKFRHLLGLFLSDIYAVKECGFWACDEDSFHVGNTTIIVGRGLARFRHKGNYEWHINFFNKDSFKNTPIQSLLDHLVNQNETEIVIPLDAQSSVSFIKESNKIISRFQYK